MTDNQWSQWQVDIFGAISFVSEVGYQDVTWALHALETTDEIYGNDPLYKTLKLGLLVDLSSHYQRLEMLNATIDEINEVLSADADNQSREFAFELGYYLGTAYQNLSDITESDQVPAERQLLQSSKRAYQSCLENSHLALLQELLPRVHVNFGNILANLGRHFEALLMYESALNIDPNYAMALGNKAIELNHFAWMTGSHELHTSVEALTLVEAALEREDALTRTGYEGASEAFHNYAERIRSRLDHHKLDEEAIHAQLRSTRKQIEHPYHQFVERHGLYLNVCVHKWGCATQYQDNLFFDYVTPIDAEGVFESRARIFNEAKEAFATARYLAFLSHEEHSFYAHDSRVTQYADLLEYANYGLKSGMQKAAFSTAYSILDKIGSFINDELNIELKPKSVYFDTVLWSNLNELTIRQKILEQKDPNLLALCDIARDLSDPHSKLKELRNAIAHRHLVVHDFIKMVGPGSNEESHLEYMELFRKSIELLTLVKAALIYLAAHLHQKDRTRSLQTGEEHLVPMMVLWQDDSLFHDGSPDAQE